MPSRKPFLPCSSRVDLMNITKSSRVKMETEPGKPGYLRFSQNTTLSHFHDFGYAILPGMSVKISGEWVGV